MKHNFRIFPSHWLFNAGVIGLLDVLEHGRRRSKKAAQPENWIREKFLLSDGSVDGCRLAKFIRWALHRPVPGLSHAKMLHWWYFTHPNQPFSKEKLRKWYEKFSGPPLPPKAMARKGRVEVVANALFAANKVLYANVLKEIGGNLSPEEKVAHLFSWERITEKAASPRYCFIWGKTNFEVFSLTIKWASYLFPSPGEFPNAFWGSVGEEGVPQVARPVAYILTCHHLAWTKIGGGVEVFVNAPSFRLMYELNKVLRSVVSKGKDLRELLALSIVGYALRIQRMLTAWTYQNIELIVKRVDRSTGNARIIVDSYTLPADIARLLVDPKVSRALSQLSSKVSTQALQLILSRKFGEIEQLLYERLREGLVKGHQNPDVKHLLHLTGRIREIQQKPI